MLSTREHVPRIRSDQGVAMEMLAVGLPGVTHIRSASAQTMSLRTRCEVAGICENLDVVRVGCPWYQRGTGSCSESRV